MTLGEVNQIRRSDQKNAFRTVKSDHVFRFLKPRCPYCGARVVAQFTGWEQHDDGTWKGTDIEVECQAMPHPRYRNKWNHWLSSHSVMPYEHWLPMQERMKAYIGDRYRFDLGEKH